MHKTISKTLKMETEGDERRNGRTIPHEIFLDILTRLPVKSLSKFRCVSKLWNSTICDPYFVKLHHNRYSADILITFPDSQSLYTTSDHRQNGDDVSVASHLLTISGHVDWYVSDSVIGLICLSVNSQLTICNPTTGEFITLPTNTATETNRPRPSCTYSSSNFVQFGYDPINNQHKLLETSVIVIDNPETELIMNHRVFVFGVDGACWKSIGDGPPHFPYYDDSGVYVNGVIYYRAWTFLTTNVLVAFDVRLETFQLIQMPGGGDLPLIEHSALIRFDGNLAIVDYQCLNYSNIMDFWILEDSLKPKWIYKAIDFSSAWADMRGDRDFYLAGTTRAGEIILLPLNLINKPFCLFFLDLINGTVRRVEIRGLPNYKLRLHRRYSNITTTDHVESIVSLSDIIF